MSQKQILLIEDDLQFRRYVAELLTSEDYSVLLAVDGSQGAKLIVEKTPDLIITDLLMPIKDGVRLITETKISHPKIPIIAMSGGSSTLSPAFLEAADTLGAAYTLTKPFKSEQLLELVNKCFN